ncbi:MAG: CinA family protein [Alphaproteobacteria bacterium]|nr:MAG: CinA family protein [Alphaproteobacteria bacterium]
MTCAPDLVARATELVAEFTRRDLSVTTAESCTGGLVAAVITEVPGASAVFDRGFVTYTNAAKSEMLGVPAPLILEYGAVSEEVARAMADGALARSHADLAVSITGIAGPSGGTPEKPVGTVCFAVAMKGTATRSWTRHFADRGRGLVREEAARFALGLLMEAAGP